MESIKDFFYYGTITNLMNIAVYALVEYVVEPETFFDRMQETGLCIAGYCLQRYNMLSKKWEEYRKEQDPSFTSKYAYFNKVSNAIEYSNTKRNSSDNEVTFYRMNDTFIELRDHETEEELNDIDTSVKPNFISINVTYNKEAVYDLYENINEYYYDGMTLNDNVIQFMIKREHNKIWHPDEEYYCVIMDSNVELHTIPMNEKYIVMDNDKETGFITLSK